MNKKNSSRSIYIIYLSIMRNCCGKVFLLVGGIAQFLLLLSGILVSHSGGELVLSEIVEPINIYRKICVKFILNLDFSNP